MLISKAADIKAAEITDESVYLNRRKFLAAAGITTAGLIGGTPALAALARRPVQVVRD